MKKQLITAFLCASTIVCLAQDKIKIDISGRYPIYPESGRIILDTTRQYLTVIDTPALAGKTITMPMKLWTQHKHRTYNIKYADTVNIYNDRTVIIIKTINGGKKYITVRPPYTYILKEANVVNYIQPICKYTEW
jgi:hypothetical protein